MTKHALIVILSCAVMLAAHSAWALGPNMMVNSGFEGGYQQYTLQDAFRIVENPKNAHTGSWEMDATLNHTSQYAYQPFACWANTDYTTSLWYKGTGAVTLQVLGSDWKTVRQSLTLSATPAWRKATLSWNSGSFPSMMIMLSDTAGSGTMEFDDFATGLTNGRTISFNANRPNMSTPKFHLLFDDEFDSIKTIDVNNTGADGYHWYTQSFYNPGEHATSSMFTVSDGVLTLMDSANAWGDVLKTAHPAANRLGYSGTVFSGGHGLYAEARIAILNIGSIGHNGWPAWWSNDMKGEVRHDDAMPGYPGKTEFIENDFMEYNPTWGSTQNWISTMHDWGSDGRNLSNTNAAITPPPGTDYSQYHIYGMLWVPATAENGWNGYRQAYFDGEPQQAVCWIGNQTYAAGVFPATNASMGSYLYSLMDRDQFLLILGSSQGGKPTMKVEDVRVYAVDASSMTVVPVGG